MDMSVTVLVGELKLRLTTFFPDALWTFDPVDVLGSTNSDETLAPFKPLSTGFKLLVLAVATLKLFALLKVG